MLEELITEKGIIKYINEYSSDRDGEQILRILVSNMKITYEKLNDSEVLFHYNLDGHKITVRGCYHPMLQDFKPEHYLYDLLFVWKTRKNDDDIKVAYAEVEEESVMNYDYFEYIFNKELGVTEPEVKMIIELLDRYFF